MRRTAQTDRFGGSGASRGGVRLALLIVLAGFGLVAAAWLLLAERWCVLATLFIATATIVAVATLRGWGNAMLATTTVLGCLILMEGYANVTSPIDVRPDGVVMHPVLGKAPGGTGLLRHAKFKTLTAGTIFDVTYTINLRHQRQVASAPQGPAIAFFGDSFTFGEGLPDAETLPQVFADLTGRQLRILNLAFSSYGTAQFLRILETGRDDDQLAPLRAIVMQTALWHAERTGCRRSFVLDAPRYEMADGKPVWRGSCRDVFWFRINRYLATSAFYRNFIEPIVARPTKADVDLYVATLVQAGRIAREKFSVPTVVLYLPWPEFAQRADVTDADIMRRLSDGGLVVINGFLDRRNFPGQELNIPNDGHPTGVANRARANLLVAGMKDILEGTKAP